MYKMGVREEVNKQLAEGEATVSNKELVRSTAATVLHLLQSTHATTQLKIPERLSRRRAQLVGRWCVQFSSESDYFFIDNHIL
jgi:hypothetical protein